jgi:hypothetical protein
MRSAAGDFALKAGDCAQLPGHLAHRIRLVGAEPASALVPAARPPRDRRAKAS